MACDMSCLVNVTSTQNQAGERGQVSKAQKWQAARIASQSRLPVMNSRHEQFHWLQLTSKQLKDAKGRQSKIGQGVERRKGCCARLGGKEGGWGARTHCKPEQAAHHERQT